MAISDRQRELAEHPELALHKTETRPAESLTSEERLSDSEERFRTIADTAPAILWITEPDGSCSFISRGWHEYTGQTEAEALGFGWLDALHPQDRQASGQIFREANEHHKSFSLDYRVRRHDGEYRWAIDSGRPRFDQNGKFLGFIGSVIDCHERKQAEQSLQEADRRKTEFLAMLAHELRNPLAPIRNTLHVLKSVEGDADRLHQAIDMMDEQIDHIVRLVDDLLDVSRISRGKLDLRREVLDLRAVANQAAQQLQPVYGERELTITVPAWPVYIHADAARLLQVLGNLLHNAAKFTEPQGHVSLTVERSDGDAVIRIRDDGVGIADDQRHGIFEMFAQVDSSLERTKSGLGLGLTLVKNLVELHGGTIDVRSEGLGRGSEFMVRVPLAMEPPKEPSSATTPADPPTAAVGHRRVLVVDDSKLAADSLATLLKLTGYDVHTRYSGAAAVAAAEELRPDAIILDIGMPEMHGYEACERIRALPHGKTIALIAVTGWGQESDIRRAEAAGFDSHLVKPPKPNDLKEVLATLLART